MDNNIKLRPILKRPDKVIPIYTCPVCGTSYKTFLEAQACKDTNGLDPKAEGLQVGDVIKLHLGYSWHKNPAWVAYTTPGNPDAAHHSDRLPTDVFYGVITKIHHIHHVRRPFAFEDNRDAHEMVFSVAWRAILMPSREDSLHNWLPIRRHRRWERCENQEQLRHLVKQVEHLLNQEAVNLI